VQLYTTGSGPTLRSLNQGSRRSALRRPIRLEKESKEETRICDLEVEIGEARRKGQPVDSLLEERKRTYELWITRLNTELANATDEAARGRIERQRDRARSQYG